MGRTVALPSLNARARRATGRRPAEQQVSIVAADELPGLAQRLLDSCLHITNLHILRRHHLLLRPLDLSLTARTNHLCLKLILTLTRLPPRSLHQMSDMRQ